MKKSFARGALNRTLGMLARFLPGATSIRPVIHKLRGVKIKGRIFIGDDVYIENEYPEQVEIEDGAQIMVRCTILAHTRDSGGSLSARTYSSDRIASSLLPREER